MSAVPSPVLKAVIAASRLPHEEPIRAAPGPAQREALDALLADLKRDFKGAHISSWSKRDVLHVPVDITTDAHRSYRYSERINLSFTGDALLMAGGYSDEGVPLSGAEQVRRAAAAIRERMVLTFKREQKRDKIRKLKERSIEAQIEALASRMRFAYALDRMHRKVVLVVRLEKGYALYVDIPHSRIQESIDEVERLITSVRDLHARGVRFKVAGSGRFHFQDPDRS